MLKDKILILVLGIGCIAFSGAVLLFVFLYAKNHPHKSPICSMEKFYVPALDKSLSSENAAATINTTISIDIRLKNENRKHSNVYYDTLNITLYYIQKGNNNVRRDLRIPIGNISIRGFYQQGTKPDHRPATVQTLGVPWKEAKMEVANGSNSRNMFMVYLTSIVGLEIPSTDQDGNSRTRIYKRKLNLGVNVSVNDQGMKTVPGSLRLTSSKSSYINRCNSISVPVVLILSCLIW
ncbi:protein NDR1-like [Papaver somniferum]|uniref:protein NDR1-like n=1 Tax=Papaver somniferum TaxID=3469 RepID=UPI000E6FA20F|nr:protein NDR1-like [Papaver somniferum]